MNDQNEARRESTYGKSILAALNILDRHVYGGTVPAAVVARRRAKNRAARVSRRVNRQC